MIDYDAPGAFHPIPFAPDGWRVGVITGTLADQFESAPTTAEIMERWFTGDRRCAELDADGRVRFTNAGERDCRLPTLSLVVAGWLATPVEGVHGVHPFPNFWPVVFHDGELHAVPDLLAADGSYGYFAARLRVPYGTGGDDFDDWYDHLLRNQLQALLDHARAAEGGAA